MPTTLLLIRHGETDWNVEGRYQGQADPPLNERGREQARRLARKLEQDPPDIIYTSPLKRAYETARIIADHLRRPLYVEPRLKEIHQGEWQTLLHTEIARRYPEAWDSWHTTPWETQIPGGETLKEVQKRVYEAIDEIIQRHPGKRIAIVAHRIPLALIKIRYQGLDPARVRQIEIPNTYVEEITIPIPSDESIS